MLYSIKQELHYQRRCGSLLAGFATRRLIYCNLQVTYRCQFRCSICDFWKTKHKAEEELSLDDIRVIGDKLARYGTFIISLAGGEPLIREDLPDIIRILNAKGHFPILITNGWHVTPDLAEELSVAGLQEISVSLDYADPKRHDTMRGMDGAWERAVSALDTLNRARRDNRRRVHMISVLMDDNLDEVEPLLLLSRKLGVTYMLSLYSWNRGVKTRRLPEDKVAARLLSLKKRYPEFVTLTSYIERLDEAIETGGVGRCQAGRLMMNIDNMGRVARCTEMLDSPAGNILIEDMDDIRAKLEDLQRTSACSECWTSCRGFAESITKRPLIRQLREFYSSVRRY
ncbi:MAG: radical SAM protein [Nitrospirae bacterium]|nr:radical SAM protein [Nitrospirota bacterium]